VVNCNLQRLDGPVRGNGKIIQELESDFRGAGWNVIKVIWGGRWDRLLAADTDGALVKVMDDCVTATTRRSSRATARSCASTSSGAIRGCSSGSRTCPTRRFWLLNAVATTAEGVRRLRPAVKHTGQPTVILAKTIKGYGMACRARPDGHPPGQEDDEDALLAFRDRFELPLTDEQVRAAEYCKPPRTRRRCVPARAALSARRSPPPAAA